jgi:hypothetical protein
MALFLKNNVMNICIFSNIFDCNLNPNRHFFHQFTRQKHFQKSKDCSLVTLVGGIRDRSCFADGWLDVVAADVVQLDAVVVEVVQDGQAELVTLAIVRLWNAASASNCAKINLN